jgi:protein O-mannosyl-transferase
VKRVTAKTGTRWELGLALGLILVTFIAYEPALRNGFVFDDYLLITENPMVKADNGLHRFWFTTEALDYYPLTWSLWWVEWRLWGNNPSGYHVINVLLHAINALLVWQILQRLKIPGAWVAAVVFAIHPVNVATVAWISEQKNTLSMLFFLMAILLYLKFDEENRWRWYGCSLVAFLLALLSKTAVAMLPVVLLGCLWWLRRRVQWNDFLRSLPFFGLSVVFGVVTLWFQHNRALEGQPTFRMGLAAQLATAGWVPWLYLDKALVPLHLTVIYPQWQIDSTPWMGYLPGLALIGCFALFWSKRRSWGRPLLFGLGYFVVMLFPVLGFFDQGFYRFSLVADHWQYYSIVGVIALAVAAAKWMDPRLDERGRFLGTVAGIAVLVALGAGTWRRDRVYASDETLWQDNAIKYPSAWIAQNNVGAALLQRGQLDDAIDHFQQALRVKPNNIGIHFNLGLAFERTGRTEEAIKHYERVLQIDPSLAAARERLDRLRAIPSR